MKKSQFIIVQEGSSSDSVLLYSTLTTSMIELDKDIYENIFENEEYDSYKDEANALKEMGFLIDNDFDELEYLKSLRVKTIEANKAEPTYYIICPTTGCNARCYYCFEKGAVQKKMNEKTARAVAEYIEKNHDSSHLVIQWFGGEPLLEPKTISYIANYLNDKNIAFDSKIITNGYLLDDEIVKMAVNDWHVKIIQITIDGIGEEYNKVKDYINPKKDPFEVVMSNIKRCLDAKINVRIRINFNPLKYDNALKTVDYLKKRFGDDSNFFIYLAPIDSDSKDIPTITGEFKNKRKHPLIELLEAEEDCSFGNYNSKYENDNSYEAILKKYYLTPIPTSCYGGCQSSLTIDSMGNIFNCHRLLGHEEYASGNVFDGRVENEISKYYSNVEIDDKECNKCALLPLCQGGCKYRASKYGKDHACTSVKGAVKDLIKRAEKELQNQ